MSAEGVNSIEIVLCNDGVGTVKFRREFPDGIDFGQTLAFIFNSAQNDMDEGGVAQFVRFVYMVIEDLQDDEFQDDLNEIHALAVRLENRIYERKHRTDP